MTETNELDTTKALLEQMLVIAEKDLTEALASDAAAGFKLQKEADFATLSEQIDSALKRIDAGEYGKCVACNKDIEPERLKELPHFETCEYCQNAGFPPGVSEDMKDRLDDGGEKPKGILDRLTERLKDEAEDLGDGVSPEEVQKNFMKIASDDRPDPWKAPTPPDAPAWAADNATARTEDPAASNGSAPARTADDKDFVDDPLPAMKKGQVRDVPLERIRPAEKNDRKGISQVKVRELAESIRSIGLLNRISVVPRDDDHFEIIAGHCRYEALRQLGWTEVPVEVFDFDESEVAVARLIENVQREDLSPTEEAQAYGRLVDLHGFSQRTLAARIGRSQSHISKRLALTELPDKAIDLIDSGRITLSDAEELLKLRAYPKRIKEVLDDVDPDNEVSYRYLSSDVQRHLQDQKIQDKIAEAKKKLKAEGVKKVVGNTEYWNLPSKHDLGKRPGQLDVDKKKHAEEPCHAAKLDQYSGSVTLFCTDWKRHRAKAGESDLKGRIVPQPKGPQLPGMSAEDNERRKQLEDADKKRKTFVRDVLLKSKSTTLSDAAALFVLCTSYVSQRGWGTECYLNASSLTQWLGVKATHKVNGRDSIEKTLGEWAAKDTANRDKFMLAAAIDNAEIGLDDLDDWPHYNPYFEFLEKHGYEISEIEQELLSPSEEKKGAS